MSFINVVPGNPRHHRIASQGVVQDSPQEEKHYFVVVEYQTETNEINKKELVFEVPNNNKVSKLELYLDVNLGWILRYNTVGTIEVGKGENIETIITKTIFPESDI